MSALVRSVALRKSRGGLCVAPVRRGMLVLALGAAVFVPMGCAASRPLPPRPTLPAVTFVPPSDPQATVGLTPRGIEELKARDAAWRQYVGELESIIRGQ